MTITIDPDDLPATRTSLGLGTAATKDTGTGNGDVPVLDSTGLPALNASQLTALNAANLTGSVADARLPANLQSFPAPGSDGNVLTASSGAWTSAAGGGGGTWELISSVVANNSATLTVTGMSTTHDVYAISVTGITAPSDGNLFHGNIGTSSGIDTTTNYVANINFTDSSTYEHQFETSSRWAISTVNNGGTTQTTGASWSGMYYITPRTNMPIIHGTYAAVGIQSGTTPNFQGGQFFGVHKTVAAYDRFQIKYGSGSIPSGRMTLWGIKHA